MAKTSRFAEQKKVILAGSDKPTFNTKDLLLPKSKSVETTIGESKARATGSVTVSVVVASREPFSIKPGTPPERLTRAAFARRHGASPASLKLVSAFAREFGLTVKPAPPGHCIMRLSGTVAAMQKAFGVELAQRTTNDGTFRLRSGPIWIPEDLSGHVLAVLGLDNRPQAKPHFRIAQPRATNVSFTPVQVGELYGFPKGATATGQTIGIIELGGGYRPADIKAYFKSLGIVAPKVKAVSVDKGKNAPSNANGADGEVMLDIEVAAAIAVGVNIVVYFAPNTDQGFIDAISTAVHDTTHKPSVISISWGGPESSWTGQATTALDAACQAAAAVGVTITVAAGDNGSTDGASGNNVDFPASSPHVLACGGTKLTGSGSSITSEVVWNETASGEGATGGGVSTIFPLPAWQKGAGVPAGGRGVPDVAGDADPSTGYDVRVDGQSIVVGGTSAVAPLWAGLIALANQQNGTAAGFINPLLYASGAKKAFRDITVGSNGAFKASPGWDPCTGLGSPIGNAVISALHPATAQAKGSTKPTSK